MNIYANIIIDCWLIFGIFWAVSSIFTKPVLKRPKLFSWFSYSVILIVSISLLFLGYGKNDPTRFINLQIISHTDLIAIIGTIITIYGLIITLWARVILGSNWSSAVVLKKNHKLIKNGPYKIVRHPIYTGLAIMYLGTAISIGNLGGIIGFPLLLISFWIKLKQEEKLMIQTFKGEYIRYMKEVKALIPYVI